MHQLCDVLEGKLYGSTTMDPHAPRTEESNQLLTGLKNLFNESNKSEQVRLMTIAPKEWGRAKIQSWYLVLNFLAANMFPVEIHSIKTTSRCFLFIQVRVSRMPSM